MKKLIYVYGYTPKFSLGVWPDYFEGVTLRLCQRKARFVSESKGPTFWVGYGHKDIVIKHRSD